MKRFACVIITLSVLSASHGVASAFYDGADVKVLTPSNFDSTLSKQDGVWAVEFYAPWCGHCKNLTPEWKKAAKALRGIVGVAAVDADAHKELGGRFGIQGFPTIKILYLKNGKLVSSDYNGGRTAADIVKAALAEASKIALGRIGAKASGGGGGGRASGGGGAQGGCGAGGGGGGGGSGQDLYGASTDIVKLTDADFHEQVTNSDEPWMIEFYAPWCGHCKNLAPHYNRFASAVKGKVKVGAVDCTQQESTCQEFGVQGYPTLKYFGENKHSPVDFDGGREESSLTAYALEKWQLQLPPPEVKQLTDDEDFIHCVGSPADDTMELAAVPGRQLCFLLFAPDILDSQAAGRNKYLDVLKKLAETHKSRPFAYLWAEAGAQPELEAAVGVGGYGYPALVALSPSKLKYAALRSAYELDAVKAFVNHVRQGSERVQPVHGDALPALKTTEPWDGKDGASPEEEEFDLADLLSEEL